MLARKRRESKDAWEEGNTLAAGTVEQLCLNAAAIGECKGHRFVQELTFDQLKGELEDDDEPERVATIGASGAPEDA